MTYVVLSLVVLLAIALATARINRRFAPRPLLWTLVILIMLTAVFDNIIVGVGLVDYDPDKISGLRVPYAPIEDFSYTLGAVMLIPALWHLVGARHRARPGQERP